MPIDPEDNISAQYPAIPYDQNDFRLSALVGTVVSGGNVSGYLPLAVTDQGDGTAILKVDTELSVDNLNISNIRVGSSNAQVSANKFLKTLDDGTVVSGVHDGLGNPITSTLVDTLRGLDARVVQDFSIESGVKRGVSFAVNINRASNNAVEDILYLVNGATKEMAFRRGRVVFDSASTSRWESYINPTVSANGSPLTIANVNRNSLNVTTSTAFDGPTVTSPGTKLSTFLITADAGRAHELVVSFILAPNDSLLIRRVTGGQGNEISMLLEWEEE